jgi:amino acid transporter
MNQETRQSKHESRHSVTAILGFIFGIILMLILLLYTSFILAFGKNSQLPFISSIMGFMIYFIVPIIVICIFGIRNTRKKFKKQYILAIIGLVFSILTLIPSIICFSVMDLHYLPGPLKSVITSYLDGHDTWQIGEYSDLTYPYDSYITEEEFDISCNKDEDCDYVDICINADLADRLWKEAEEEGSVVAVGSVFYYIVCRCHQSQCQYSNAMDQEIYDVLYK